MTKVLVIGAKGQLGQSFQYCATQFPGFEFFFKDLPQLDLLDNQQLHQYFTSTPTDIVINCVAYTEVDQAENEPKMAHQLNALAIESLSQLSKSFGFKLIHFSTDYVFDGSATKPYKESETLNPIGVYGLTKAEGEALMRSAGIDGWIIRTSWLFSPYGKNRQKPFFPCCKTKPKSMWWLTKPEAPPMLWTCLLTPLKHWIKILYSTGLRSIIIPIVDTPHGMA